LNLYVLNFSTFKDEGEPCVRLMQECDWMKVKLRSTAHIKVTFFNKSRIMSESWAL